jgi:MYXO-CTERM domain-containing protein
VRLTDFLTNYDREIRPRHVRALGSKVLFFADDDAPGAKLFSLDVDAPAVTDGGEGTGGTGTVGGTAGTSGASGTAMGGAGGSGTTAAAAGGNGSTGASANTSGSGTGGSDAGAGGGAMGSGDSSSAGENGSSDAATDPGESRADRGGCNCRASGDRSATGALSGWLALIALAVAAGRRTLRRAQERN